ncbi:P-loop containing nucleoside triphosphate hydrolase protein [Ceratobasidium sp. AG-Ba]|nr:P-loop containing nucleoside triphosphate hydrolase protein [Ceratobasidium sp. AG-Ba]
MYDMERVSVQHVSELDYSLVVPGLSEKRPSVIVTDLVAMKEPGSSRNNLHGGYVTEVQQSSVILRMHESFPSVANQLWDVRFTVNRLLLRRMHDAINKAGPHARILFPQVSDKVSPSTALGSSPRLDRKVAANYEQSLAVRQILGQAAGDVPFVIFGPRRFASARSAAYSIVEDKKFKSPPKHELVKFRVVVSTCYYASIPRALGIENHFTHIFVDEAGHATEPEVMVAVLQNAGPKTNIMCGDPMQLGPIVQSKECAKLGLGKSFLDRLMKLPLYPKIVKLLENYRSHPAILRFPDVAFYKNQLEYKADPVITQSLVRFSELPQSGFPIIFHSICGHNSQEAKSPSYFNIDEATLVKHYVRALLSDRRHALKAQDIGVISPYRQQCIKIRQLLKKERHEGVDVKVTEDWQGQERRVIIVSTVRSDPELPETSAAEFLGFVSKLASHKCCLHSSTGVTYCDWPCGNIGARSGLVFLPSLFTPLEESDDSGYPPRLNSNVFLGKPQPIKNYEEFDDARWKALIKAAEAF